VNVRAQAENHAAFASVSSATFVTMCGSISSTAGWLSASTHSRCRASTGCQKTDPRLFQMALQALGTRPNETLMVGDRPLTHRPHLLRRRRRGSLNAAASIDECAAQPSETPVPPRQLNPDRLDRGGHASGRVTEPGRRFPPALMHHRLVRRERHGRERPAQVSAKVDCWAASQQAKSAST
jgi:hypothetical protein